MTIALAVLAVTAVSLMAERLVVDRSHRAEIATLHEAILEANRQAIVAVMSRNGAEFSRNEAVGRATAEQLGRSVDRPERELRPVAEGLGG